MGSPYKSYVGDGVYIDYDERSDQIALTTEDGVAVTNTIWIERSVWEALLAWQRTTDASCREWRR